MYAALLCLGLTSAVHWPAIWPWPYAPTYYGSCEHCAGCPAEECAAQGYRPTYNYRVEFDYPWRTSRYRPRATPLETGELIPGVEQTLPQSRRPTSPRVR